MHLCVVTSSIVPGQLVGREQEPTILFLIVVRSQDIDVVLQQCGSSIDLARGCPCTKSSHLLHVGFHAVGVDILAKDEGMTVDDVDNRFTPFSVEVFRPVYFLGESSEEAVSVTFDVVYLSL